MILGLWFNGLEEDEKVRKKVALKLVAFYFFAFCDSFNTQKSFFEI